jgi:hypothetical protein
MNTCIDKYDGKNKKFFDPNEFFRISNGRKHSEEMQIR